MPNILYMTEQSGIINQRVTVSTVFLPSIQIQILIIDIRNYPTFSLYGAHEHEHVHVLANQNRYEELENVKVKCFLSIKDALKALQLEKSNRMSIT